MEVAEDSSFLSTGVLLYNPLWHMMGSPKVTTINISANKMAGLEHAETVSTTAEGRHGRD
jgi:hypothetical protein